MSKNRGNNREGLPTVDEVFSAAGLSVVGTEDPSTESQGVGLPSWVGESSGTPLPSALTVELAALHERKAVAEHEVEKIDAERAALFRGYLVGAGISLRAQYDLSTGMVTIPPEEA